jgi:hypothetical protein
VSDARKKHAAFLKRNKRARRARCVSGQRNKNDAVVAEQVALAADSVDLYWKVPFLRKIAGHLGLGRARRCDLLFVDDESRALKKSIAAAMVGMQMRADYDIDVAGRDPDRF